MACQGTNKARHVRAALGLDQIPERLAYFRLPLWFALQTSGVCMYRVACVACMGATSNARGQQKRHKTHRRALREHPFRLPHESVWEDAAGCVPGPEELQELLQIPVYQQLPMAQQHGLENLALLHLYFDGVPYTGRARQGLCCSSVSCMGFLAHVVPPAAPTTFSTQLWPRF